MNATSPWTSLWKILALCAVPTISMAAGGVLVQFYQPGPRLSAVLQHFAAGVVFGALSIEMLPLLENATGWAFGALLGGYVAGVIVMLVVGRVIPHFFGEMDDVIEQHEKAKQEQAPERALDSVVAGDRVEEAQNDAPAAPTDQQHQLQPSAYAILSPAADADAIEQGAPHEAPSAPSAAVEPQVHHEMNEMVPHKLTRRKGRIPWGLVTPVFIDALVDGLLVGISFGAGESAALIMAIAIAIEMCLLGTTVSLAMNVLSVSRAKALMLCIGVPLGIPIAGTFGAFLLANLDPESPAFIAIISFGAAALMYLVVCELLVEAYGNADADKWYITMQFFTGFLVPVFLQKLESYYW